MGSHRIVAQGNLQGLGRCVVTPEQRVNLLSENQILDARKDNKDFKYKIINVRNHQDVMEGYNIIINTENNRRIQTKRDRDYHGFHQVMLSQIKYLNNKVQVRDGNQNKFKTGMTQQQHVTEENKQGERTGARCLPRHPQLCLPRHP